MHSASQSSSVLIPFSETNVSFKLSPTFVNLLKGFCLLKSSIQTADSPGENTYPLNESNWTSNSGIYTGS
jgi:hypothetical protein